jgi:FkbM family methyltransferase
MNPQHVAAQILLRAWPFPRGAGRIIDRFFAKLKFKDQTTVVRTTDEFDISVMPNDLIGRHLYLTGEFDRSIVEILLSFADPGDTLLDIGANIGYVSSCFLKNVPDSKVVAVEPQPDVLAMLKTNLDRFGRSKIYPYAISDQDGEAWFQIDRHNMGAGRLINGAPNDHSISIKTRTADSLFFDTNIERIDLVKIDAEGAEEAIIRSCANHFAEKQPKAIIFEDNNRNAGGNISKALRSAGYKIYCIKKSLRSLTLTSFNASAPTFAECHDYIAISARRAIPERARKIYRLKE